MGIRNLLKDHNCNNKMHILLNSLNLIKNINMEMFHTKEILKALFHQSIKKKRKKKNKNLSQKMMIKISRIKIK